MSKWYQVEMVSRKLVAVEVEDDTDEDAILDIAGDAVVWFDPDEWKTVEVEGEEDIDRLIRYADEVVSIEEGE